MDTGTKVCCDGCGNSSGNTISGKCCGGHLGHTTSISCVDSNIRYRKKTLTAEYMTARVIDVRDKIRVSQLKLNNIRAHCSEFHKVCVDGHLCLKNGAPLTMSHGANNSITFVDASEAKGFNIYGNFKVRPPPSTTSNSSLASVSELSVSETGTFINGFTSIIQNKTTEPARVLIGNEAPNQKQQLVIATEYTGSKPPESGSSGGDTLSAGPAFALTVDPVTESIELAPTNESTKSGLSYSQYVYVPNRPDDPPVSQGKHVFVGDVQVFTPPSGTPSGPSAPVIQISQQGTRIYNPTEFWTSEGSDVATSSTLPSMITKLDSEYSTNEGGLFIGGVISSADPLESRIPNFSTAYVKVGGVQSSTETVVEIFKTLKIGPLTIEYNDDEDYVQFSMNGNPYMIFDSETVRIVRDFKANNTSTANPTSSIGVSVGGVPLATLPMVETSLDAFNYSNINLGDMYVDGNGFLMVKRDTT